MASDMMRKAVARYNRNAKIIDPVGEAAVRALEKPAVVSGVKAALAAGLRGLAGKAIGLSATPVVGDMLQPREANAFDDVEAIKNWRPRQ